MASQRACNRFAMDWRWACNGLTIGYAMGLQRARRNLAKGALAMRSPQVARRTGGACSGPAM
eukprot:3566041-Alexandrium_andersonii.AAC.1